MSHIRHWGYPNLTDLTERLEKLFINDVCQDFVAGNSYEGRSIQGVLVGENARTIPSVSDADGFSLPIRPSARPTVLLTGLHHAREIISTTTVLSFLEHYVACTTDLCRYIKNNLDVIAVPIVNPDGLALMDREGSKDVRKNTRPTCPDHPSRSGVDLNRNYGFKFNANIGPCDEEEYGGSAPFSEPETQSIRRMAQRYPMVSALNFHTFGDVWTHPYNCCEHEAVDEHAHKAFQSFRAWLPSTVIFDPAPINPLLLYETSGEADDYLLAQHGIISMSPEVGPESVGFWPHYEMIETISQESIPRIYEILYRSMLRSYSLSASDTSIELSFLTWIRRCDQSEAIPEISFCVDRWPENVSVFWLEPDGTKTLMKGGWNVHNSSETLVLSRESIGDRPGRLCLEEYKETWLCSDTFSEGPLTRSLLLPYSSGSATLNADVQETASLSVTSWIYAASSLIFLALIFRPSIMKDKFFAFAWKFRSLFHRDDQREVVTFAS